MLKPTSVIAIAALAQSCATAGNGSLGSTAPISPLRISACELPELASDYFGAVEVTFENQSPVWIQIDSVALDFGSPEKNQSVAIPQGPDIDSWARAVLQGRDAFVNHGYVTRELVQLGVLNNQASPQPQTSPQPAAALAPAAAPAGPSFPATHLLAVPFRIPPGLFAKRWLVLGTGPAQPAGCIDSMTLDYQTADGWRERVPVHFKALGSAWQAPACPLPQYAAPPTLPL
jgi:hypothetical protein